MSVKLKLKLEKVIVRTIIKEEQLNCEQVKVSDNVSEAEIKFEKMIIQGNK